MKKFTKILALTLVLLMSVAMFASCANPNKDPKKAEEALKDAGYDVTLIDDADFLKLMGVDKLEAVISAFNEDDENDAVFIYYFEDSAAADEAYEDIEKEFDEIKTSEDAPEDLVLKKSGKMIWYGTKDAIKAAK